MSWIMRREQVTKESSNIRMSSESDLGATVDETDSETLRVWREA
jgi:hypothetical protein